MANLETKVFKSGVHNLLMDEIIPQDAASDANNWYTQDGRIKLVAGRQAVGAEGAIGKITGEIFGYRTDGTTIHWAKFGSEIKYFNGTAWVTVITGLTVDADYTFSNYSSLAGAFTFAFGIDGIFKMNNANPGSYNSMYNSVKNFKGYAFIDKGRAILWNRPEDKTGIYGSYIDAQNATVYTTVAGEATVSLGGTLAFKAGGATRNAFNVTIVVGAETFRDNYNGLLVGSLGGTGTINYMTGAYTVSAAGVGTAGYQWEDSNAKGVTDFSKSGTRLAGEGFQFPQDEGGDPIMVVLVGPDGAYYSLKRRTAYRLSIGDDDLTADNNIFRKEIGVASLRGAISTGQGIVFMNVANPEKPQLTILQKNPIGDAVEPYVLFAQFKFANYSYNDCAIDFYDRYIVVACLKNLSQSSANQTMLLCDIANKTVDITGYSARTLAKDAGILYIGSPITYSVYKVFVGFDDNGLAIDNNWDSKAETYKTTRLKKYRKNRFKGNISPEMAVGVYANYDDSGWQLIGTILGSGDYVDYTSEQVIGGNIIGHAQIGGDDSIAIYPFYIEIRLRKVPKFRTRKIRFKALGIGYVDIDTMIDWDIMSFQDKIPARFRLKQNVSLDGSDTNLDDSTLNSYLTDETGLEILADESDNNIALNQ